MNGFLLLTALLAPVQNPGVGEDLWMWKQNDQGIEYIVQIEPPVVTAMTTGKEVYSNVPEQMQVVNINRVRFRHGTGKFTEADVASTVGLLGVTYGYQPLVNGGIEFLVQIPPSGVEEFRKGRDVIIDIPVEAKKIQRFVVLVGNDTLPRSLTAPANGGSLPPPPISSTTPGPIVDPNAPSSLIPPPGLGESPYPYQNPTGTTPPSRRANQEPLRVAPPYGDPSRMGSIGPSGYGKERPPYLASDPGLSYRQPAAPNYQQPAPPNYQQPAPPNYQQPAAPNYQQPAAPDYQQPPARGYQPVQPSYPYSTSAPGPNLNAPQPHAPTTSSPLVTTTPPPPLVATQPPPVTASPISAQRPSSSGLEEEVKKANILPNFLTVMALFASLGANLFLGWVAMQLYDRYRRALTDMRDQSRRVARA